MPDIAYMAVPFAYPNFPVPGLSVKGAAGGIGGEYLGLEGPVAFRLRRRRETVEQPDADALASCFLRDVDADLSDAGRASRVRNGG